MFEKKKQKIIKVEGMHCESCAKRIKKALETKKEIKKIKIDLKKKEVILTYTNSLDEQGIKNLIEDLGYQVTEIKEG